MEVYVGLDVCLKRTEICVSDGVGAVLWRCVADTAAEMVAEKPSVRREGLVKVGLETGSMTPPACSGAAGAGTACRGDARAPARTRSRRGP